MAWDTTLACQDRTHSLPWRLLSAAGPTKIMACHVFGSQEAGAFFSSTKVLAMVARRGGRLETLAGEGAVWRGVSTQTASSSVAAPKSLVVLGSQGQRPWPLLGWMF